MQPTLRKFSERSLALMARKREPLCFMFPSTYMIIIKPFGEKNSGRARKMMHSSVLMRLWETVYRKKLCIKVGESSSTALD